MTLLEVAKHALEAMEDAMYRADTHEFYDAKESLRYAIEQAEQAEQEPVAWMHRDYYNNLKLAQIEPPPPLAFPVYAHPPSKPWVGLTDEQKDAARWRFLVDNSFDKEGVTQFHVWEHLWEPHSQTGEPTEWKQRVRGPALDRFIDRAIDAKLLEKNHG